MTEVLKVFLWEQEIGRLAWHDARKTTFFVYNPEFLKGTLDVAPLTASIHNPLSTRAIFGEAERIYQKLPSFIADSLPDAWGNQLFEQWRKDNNLTERSVTSLEKENHGIKKENALVIYALGACLDGLHQQGCNGKVTEAMEKIINSERYEAIAIA